MQGGAILPVILCGGEGRRLAPLSSVNNPKQFHALAHDDLSLLQQTILRVNNAHLFAPPVLFGNERHESHIKEQLAAIECVPSAVFLEPIMRNTAAPVLLSALYAQDAGFERMLVLPSDHRIHNEKVFIRDASIAAQGEEIISYFGITPDRPYSGYGYIQETSKGIIFYEKPEAQKAATLIANRALWNSGIFLLQVTAFLEAAAHLMPDLFEVLSQDGFDAYSRIPDVSFDKTFCERTSSGKLYKANFDWMDLGSWEALAALETKESAA